MNRSLLVLSPLVLSLVCGCGTGPAVTESASQKTPADTKTPAVVASADEPILESVPVQGEPSQPGDSTAAVAFERLVKAAETGDAEGWASGSGTSHAQFRSRSGLVCTADGREHGRAELAAMFLAQLGPDAAPAAKGLVKLLDDESAFARVNAAAALSTFDGHAEQAAPVLAALLSDSDMNVRLTAATSLRNTGAEAAKFLTSLTRSLGDPDARVRAAAATTLGELGSSAESSLKMLKQLQSDGDEQVATAASRAIRRIDGTASDASALAIPASATE